MRYVALAVAYDGTLAEQGRCDERCVGMLRAIAATGRKLILVTGRELRELLEIFPQVRLFDAVIAENGAVMHQPAARESAILAQAPPEILVQELERHVHPLSIGNASIRTHASHANEVRRALAKLELECQLIINEETLTILPSGIDKASGVQAALREFGVSPHNLAVVGANKDEESLFSIAGCAAAVCGAPAALQSLADHRLRSSGPEGFVEFARKLIETDLTDAAPRHTIELARAERGRIAFAPGRESVLIEGAHASDRHAVCGRLLDQMLLHDFQCCVLSAELGPAPIVRSPLRVLGEPHDAPRLAEVIAALEHPAVSVSVNLAALAPDTRPLFAEALLMQLHALHDRVGRPHGVFIQQAESFVSQEVARLAARMTETTLVLTTARAAALPDSAMAPVKYLVALGHEGDTPSHRQWNEGSLVQAVTAGGAPCWIGALRSASAPAPAAASAPAVVLSG